MNGILCEDPMTCELRVGDMVEVVYAPHVLKGERVKILDVRNDAFYTEPEWNKWSNRSSLKLIARAGAPVQATPKEQASASQPPAAPVLKKDEFSERGVLPSDVAGINEMVKRMFKEKRDEIKPAPAKPPSHAGLLITASERYLGLGFNDEMGAP